MDNQRENQGEIFLDARYTVTRGPETWVTLEHATKMCMLTEFQRSVIGPRLVGGVYRSAYWGDTYEVTRVDCSYRYVTRKYWGDEHPVTELESGSTWIACKWSDGHVTRHCTRWDERDSIISQPPLPVRPVKRAPQAPVKLTFVPFGPNHDCSLCKPGLIGKMERYYRRGMVHLSDVMSDAFWVGLHHKSIATTPGVSMIKASDPIAPVVQVMEASWDGELPEVASPGEASVAETMDASWDGTW